MVSSLILFCLSVSGVLSANILYITPLPSPSHHIWNRALALGLVSKGHNVTLLGLDEDNMKLENYTHILIKGVYEAVYEDINPNDVADYSPFQLLTEMQSMGYMMCEIYFKSEGLKTLLNYPDDAFDAILIDVCAGGCLYPLIQKFKYPPTVAVTPFLLPQFIANNFGNHLYPAYLPWYGLPYGSEMSFSERVWNFLFTYSEVILRSVKQYKSEHALTKKFFGEDVPSGEDFERHISLVLTNTDPVIDRPQPLTSNFIPVGGLHTRKSQPLPKDLQLVLDNSKNGVILFSLGTNVRSDKLTEKIQKALIDAFSQIKETVIWKFESEIENLPKNVIVRKWLPQNDILGHPNVKLFIGHGGALSTQESIFHGVPIICIPFFMDQHINAKSMVDKKIGISLDLKQITSDYVLRNVREILDNPIYSENGKKISKIFRDRTETPLERAVFWVEYAIRNGGAAFLTSPAKELPFYVASGLDVAAFLVAISTIIVVVVFKLFKRLLKPLSSKKKLKEH